MEPVAERTRTMSEGHERNGGMLISWRVGGGR